MFYGYGSNNGINMDLSRTEEMTHGFTKLTVIELFNCLLEI
ncbi:2490_t:CDS:2 [Entrophospora sp. SA101]|nr:2490_t:CDS:2 [Entrophospora sp. SA101]